MGRSIGLWRIVAAGVLTAAPVGCSGARVLAPVRAAMSGRIGCHRLTFRATTVRGAASFGVRPASATYVVITELHPDSTAPLRFHYLVSGGVIAPFERVYVARGFGPVTYFLRTPGRGARPNRIGIRNLAGPKEAPRILSVRGVTRAELDRARTDDRFTLMGTVINPIMGMPEDDQARKLASELPVAHERRIGKAFSYEVLYAGNSPAAVRAQIERARAWSRQHGMPALLGFVSWWNGTPVRVPDGLGGAFGDLRYQQVCYTPGAEHAENADLRKLLGARYNRHYRLSVPNIWSNTPWLTLNSPTLNAYRARRMNEAVRILHEVSGGDVSWVAGVYLENEPRYWDTQSTEGTPQWAGEQWADFNPLAVEQARRDGVTLDPADGLSPAELAWLQMNAARYFQQTVDAMTRALRQQGLAGRFPIYTHSLQIPALFPCCKINRSPADWARAAGAFTGIEGIWSNLSDFDRVREWGPWTNLNREETDGLPIETHLWDLRVSYAAGASHYNSYNWHQLKGAGYFGYASQFLAGLPAVELSPARVERTAPTTLAVTPPMALQACTSLTVSVTPEAPAAVARVALEAASARSVWFSERARMTGAAPRDVTFTFPAPAEMPWSAPSIVRLHAYDRLGREVAAGATFTAGMASGVRMRLDLGGCRAQSRVVIGWHRAGAR